MVLPPYGNRELIPKASCKIVVRRSNWRRDIVPRGPHVKVGAAADLPGRDSERPMDRTVFRVARGIVHVERRTVVREMVNAVKSVVPRIRGHALKRRHRRVSIA